MATKKTKPRAKRPPSKPSKPKGFSRGGGDADMAEAAALRMDSGSENFFALGEPPKESAEEKIERLRKELPDGYAIFSTEGMIHFSDWTEEPAAVVESKPSPGLEPAQPKPYHGRRVVFEANQTWEEKIEPESKSNSSLAPMMMGEVLNEVEIEGLKRNLFFTLSRLRTTALSNESAVARDAAGRVIANVVAEILNDWPEKATYQTCVSKTIRQIKRDNEGFKKRWHGELHMKGVKKKRVGIEKELENFVRDAQFRLACLVDEVAHALVGGEAPLARLETSVLAKWMVKIPGVPEIAKEARKKTETFSSKIDIDQLVNQAIRADVPSYFRQVFRPALENGLWCKMEQLRGLVFKDHADVMQTMLKTIILKIKE